MSNDDVHRHAQGAPLSPDTTGFEDQALDHPGGRVVHDARGRAMWDWAIATGVLAGKNAGALLQMLDNPELAIAGEAFPRDWGGDPYNRG